MSNIFDDMRRAVQDAKVTLRAADSVAEQLGELLKGRMRMIKNSGLLVVLKRELQDFDAHKKEWKK